MSAGGKLRRARWFGCFAFGFATFIHSAHSDDLVVIGDSLSAEYAAIPEIAGFSTEPTRYADVTVRGWTSMSWSEIIARLHIDGLDLGRFRRLSDPWIPPRLSGYEFNWGIPGLEAGQYEDFVTSSVTENFAYFALRQPLENQLRNEAERVVIWLGTNDFRANYGRFYDDENPDAFIDSLIGDLTQIIDFVQRKNGALQIVIANIPDLGATPSKREAHPDPARRARVTAATTEANARIAQLAAQKGLAVADTYSVTARLISGAPLFFGAVKIADAADDDNNPRFAWTRDGLHPNTALQIEIARAIIRAFNDGFAAALPQITDFQALALLRIDPNEPYYEWLELHGLSKRRFSADSDGDHLNNLVEYAFGLDPSAADADALPVRIDSTQTPSGLVLAWTPDAARVRHVRIQPQYSLDGALWQKVPSTEIVVHDDGSLSATAPVAAPSQIRLKISVIPPSGASSIISKTFLTFE
jgi:lysophospholipase L1-like esterase